MLGFIGDSHCLAFTGYPGVEVRHLGAIRAHDTSEWRQDFDDVMHYHMDMPWVLTIGGLDCRILIYEHSIKHGVTLEQAVLTATQPVIELLESWAGRVKLLWYRIPPGGYQGNYYKVEHYAPREVHQQIVDLFNVTMEKRLVNSGVWILDLVPFYWDRSTVVAPESLYDKDKVHIKPALIHRALTEFFCRKVGL
jgi:hypothetical protein